MLSIARYHRNRIQAFILRFIANKYLCRRFLQPLVIRLEQYIFFHLVGKRRRLSMLLFICHVPGRRGSNGCTMETESSKARRSGRLKFHIIFKGLRLVELTVAGQCESIVTRLESSTVTTTVCIDSNSVTIITCWLLSYTILKLTRT